MSEWERSNVEWDVKLWTYVLNYNGKKYPLGVSRIQDAENYASIKLIQLMIEEDEQERNTQ
jgi:hypothetical protein